MKLRGFGLTPFEPISNPRDVRGTVLSFILRHVAALRRAVPAIHFSTMIRAPRGRCFDLSRSVELHVRSAQATGERAIAGKTSGLLALGDEITWRGKHFGIWLELTSRITEFEWPGHFRDSFVRGPLARFDHDHRFDEASGETRMEDVFDYSAPLGVLGDLAGALFLSRYLDRFLRERALVIKRVAESDEWRSYLSGMDVSAEQV